VSCRELQAAVSGDFSASVILGEEDKCELNTFDSDAYQVLDATARKQYKERLGSIDRELLNAERNNDMAQMELLAEEKQALIDELQSNIGLAGRPREFATDAEKSRKAVSRTIKTALTNIRKQHPKLANHLEHCIKFGAACRYEGDGIPWDF
jgi:hypothetical protein